MQNRFCNYSWGSIFAACLIATTTTKSSCAAVVTAVSVERSYSGQARTTNAGGVAQRVPLSASATGLGSLGEVRAFSSNSGVVSTAIGVESSVLLTDLAATSSTRWDFETSVAANHITNVALVNTPSFGQATSSIVFDGRIDTSAFRSPRSVIFSKTHTSTGRNVNEGRLTITSDVRGNVFSSDIFFLPSDFSVTLNPGEIVSLGLTMESSVRQDPGSFVGIGVGDSNSQQFSLSVTSVPEPSQAVAIVALGVVTMVIRKRRKIG